METQDKSIAKYVIGGIVGLIVLIFLFGSFGVVPAGARGVETRFGAVVRELSPGLYFKIPIVEGVTQMNVQTQAEAVTAVEGASQDLQQVTTDVTVNYHLEPTDITTVYNNIGVDYASKVIDPAIKESVKATTAKYTAEQLITEREKVRLDIINLLTTKFQQFNLQLDALNITNFNFSPDFNTAIEAKVTAQQNALAAQNKLLQVQYEASQTIATAQANAEAIQIQTEAINSQGGADYVQLQAIKQWDGHLPQYMIPGSSVPFINLPNSK